MSRIIVLGATGYTGDLTARSLVRQGARPVLAGRDPGRVEALAAELGGLDTAIVDVGEPATLRDVLRKGDVLISTVGPFLKHGRPAVEAAAEMGVHYLDSTGEGPFIREVFERWGPIARRHDAALITAFGYDYGPGAYAAALALDEAGDEATAVDIAYFSPGFAPSGGTRASALGVVLEAGHAFRDGGIRTERPGSRTKRFDVDGRSMVAGSVPAAEQFGLPPVYPRLREVDVFLGFPESTARLLPVASRVMGAVGRIGLLKRGVAGITDRMVKGSTGGPDTAERARATSVVVAVARSASRELATVTLTGPNPYEITADLLAWGAITAAAGGLRDTGALGPLGAFGLDALATGCREAGMSVGEPGIDP